MFAEAREVRYNFAQTVKSNYKSILSMNEFEPDVLRALYRNKIIDERVD